MVRPMTDHDDRIDESGPASPPDDLAFEVETESMADGRHIHYYRWPDPVNSPADAPPIDDV